MTVPPIISKPKPPHPFRAVSSSDGLKSALISRPTTNIHAIVLNMSARVSDANGWLEMSSGLKTHSVRKIRAKVKSRATNPTARSHLKELG